MTQTQKLQIEASKQRARLNEIAGLSGDAMTPEIRTEADTLTATYETTETQLRASLAAEPDPAITETDPNADPETRERIELRGRSRVGAFLLGALQGRMVSGAEAEYAAAVNAPAGEIPMDLWESDRPSEVRAATPAPAAGTGVTVAPVQPFLFAASIAPRLGIDMPSVMSGGYSEMTISTKLPAGPIAKGGDATNTAGALTAVTANPRRVSARMTVTLEDVAAIGQANFESALRQNVSMALSDAYDNQAINGNGTSPNVEGLIDQLTDPTNPTVVAAFDDFVAAFADSIDGLWASTPREVSIVANVAAFKLSAKTFRDGSGGQSRAGDMAFSDYAKAHYGGWWTNKRMPATASTIARGIVFRMGRMGLRTACHPTWGTVSVDDIYTDSRSGQRHFTVHALVGDKVLIVQPDAYSLVEYKVA